MSYLYLIPFRKNNLQSHCIRLVLLIWEFILPVAKCFFYFNSKLIFVIFWCLVPMSPGLYFLKIWFPVWLNWNVKVILHTFLLLFYQPSVIFPILYQFNAIRCFCNSVLTKKLVWHNKVQEKSKHSEEALKAKRIFFSLVNTFCFQIFT